MSADRDGVDLDDRLGIQPLDALHAERDRLTREIAPLKSLYGAFGGWESTRKMRLATVSLRIRAGWDADARGRLTEDRLDDESHADPAFVLFIDTSNLERADFIIKQAALDSVDDRIRERHTLIHHDAATARLT